MKFKKFAAIGIAALMAAGVLAGCSSTVDETQQPAGELPHVYIPENDVVFQETWMDLDGRVITMLCIRAGRGDNRWDYDWDDAERTPNETLRVMEILRQIEREYNTTIEIEWIAAGNVMPTLTQNRTAGDAPFDLFETGLTEFGVQSLYTGRHVMPVTHPEIVDIIKPHDNPWLEASAFSIVGDTQFAVHFKPLNSPDILRSTLMFNDTLRQQLNLPNFYDMVRSGTWTWDEFDSILNQAHQQSDGTFFPIIHGHEGLIIPLFIYSNNGTLAENTPYGLQFVGHTNDNALEAMNFVLSFAQRGFFHPSSGQRDAPLGLAASQGEALFIFNWYDTMKNLTRNIPGHDGPYTFGILPTPIGPRYDRFMMTVYTEVLYHVMADIHAPAEAAAVLVAIANRTRVPDAFRIQHELNYSLQSDCSAEMMAIMLENVKIDRSRIHGEARRGGGDALVAANNRVLAGSQTPVQAMQGIANSMQSWFDALNVLDE